MDTAIRTMRKTTTSRRKSIMAKTPTSPLSRCFLKRLVDYGRRLRLPVITTLGDNSWRLQLLVIMTLGDRGSRHLFGAFTESLHFPNVVALSRSRGAHMETGRFHNVGALSQSCGTFMKSRRFHEVTALSRSRGAFTMSRHFQVAY